MFTRSRIGRLTITALLILTFLASCARSLEGDDESTVARSPWITYQGGGSVHVIRADGTDGHPLTTTPQGNQEHPDWSPDGHRLVMDVDFLAIWLVGVDGSDAKEIYRCESPCVFIQDAAWSPDGKEIAFLRYSGQPTGEIAAPAEIVALDVATGDERVLFQSPRATDVPYSPRWSPDGSHLVVEEVRFASDRSDESRELGSRVVVVATDGTGVRRELTSHDFDARGVDWSVDDRIITSSRGNLWSMRPDGSDQQQLTTYDGVREHAIQPTWTPDGQDVVFTHVTGEFGQGEFATLGRLSADGVEVWPEGSTTLTHPRLQPTPGDSPP